MQADVFEEMLKQTPLSACFKNASDKLGDLDGAVNFILRRVEKLFKASGRDKESWKAYVTTAVDERNAETLLQSIQLQAFSTNLSDL